MDFGLVFFDLDRVDANGFLGKFEDVDGALRHIYVDVFVEVSGVDLIVNLINVLYIINLVAVIKVLIGFDGLTIGQFRVL